MDFLCIQDDPESDSDVQVLSDMFPSVAKERVERALQQHGMSGAIDNLLGVFDNFAVSYVVDVAYDCV